MQQILDDCNKINCAEVVKYQNNLTTAQNNYQAAKYAFDAANLTFGGPNFSTLFLTAATSVYSVETAVRGLVPGSR